MIHFWSISHQFQYNFWSIFDQFLINFRLIFDEFLHWFLIHFYQFLIQFRLVFFISFLPISYIIYKFLENLNFKGRVRGMPRWVVGGARRGRIGARGARSNIGISGHGRYRTFAWSTNSSFLSFGKLYLNSAVLQWSVV